MAISHSYVSLPEGLTNKNHIVKLGWLAPIERQDERKGTTLEFLQ